MSWALGEREGRGRCSGETLRRSGAPKEGRALGGEVGISADRWRRLLSAELSVQQCGRRRKIKQNMRVCRLPWEPWGLSVVLGFPGLVAWDWVPEGCLAVGR